MLHSDGEERGGGSTLGRSENWRGMDSAEEKYTHEQDETSRIEASSENLFESTVHRVTLYSDGQYTGPDLLSENGNDIIAKQILQNGS